MYFDLLFVHHDSFVMHASSKTSTTWRFSMFSNSSVTHGNFSSHVSRLLQSGDLYDEKTSKKAANKGPSCGTLTISLKIDLINI